MKLKILFIIALSFLLITACKDENRNTNPSTKCGDAIHIVQDTVGLPRGLFSIRETTIDGDCMTLRLDYGGGCGGKIDFQLYSFGEYILDDITHYKIYVALDDEDYCKALIEKQVKFDMTDFKKQIKNSVYYINFVNTKDSLLIGD